MRRRAVLLGSIAIIALVAIAIFVALTAKRDRAAPDWIRASSPGREHTGTNWDLRTDTDLRTYTKAWEIDKPFKEVVNLLNNELTAEGWTKSKSLSDNFHEWTVKDQNGINILKIETFVIANRVKVVFQSQTGPSALDKFQKWIQDSMGGSRQAR